MLTVQEYLQVSTKHFLKFLQEMLPQVGGKNWWQETIIDKLNEHQLRVIEQKNFSKLADFDLAFLIRLLERNWRDITNNVNGLDYRNGLNLIYGLINIRNHYAHEPLTGTLLNQKIRDVDSIVRLLKVLNADETAIQQGEVLHVALMKAMLESLSEGDGVEEQEANTDSSNQENNSENTPEGIPVSWLKANTILDEEILHQVNSSTYIGIDFGTSTSVASIAVVNDDKNGLHAKAIEIRQIDDLGREIHSHLVNTCLAWFNNKLLFGIGAKKLEQELIANQSIWTSFKMGLGIDLGPEYNRTMLPNGKHEYTIEKPQHAAAVFLKLMCDGIKKYVEKHNLPKKIHYAVTVPASFEANQRQDLFRALEFAGIPEDEIRLMDEPNAAFLSYLIDMETKSTGTRFVDNLQKPKNVIIFDFGAGTCDISILEISSSQQSILSRNLGISKFWALGGDDIDNVIAEKILLPQLCGGKGIAKYLFTSSQLEKQVLPHLKSVAEILKIACCELAEQRGWKTLDDLRSAHEKITGKPSKPLEIVGKQWLLAKPQITTSEFADVMALFVGLSSAIDTDKEIIDVLRPIDNALEKIELTKDDIDMVLFIGGSCENPMIRHYVSQHLGRFVESITPRDLRAHVSQGAALYSLFTHGADIDPIRPITSETIYVLTVGEKLQRLIKAGSLVPSEKLFTIELEVTRDDQRYIELPFYSGSVNKPIGNMRIENKQATSSDSVKGFKKGEKVKVTCSITKEKLLQVEVEVNQVKQVANFQNPLANEEITQEMIAMLKAKQTFNQSVLEGHGRPSVNATLIYASAARKAKYWRLAAEMFDAVERLDPDRDYATSICYCYSKDGDYKNSHKWSKTAYERTPSALTAFNYAVDQYRSNDIDQYEKLMQEAIAHDPNYTAALVDYGKHLMDDGEELGTEYLQRAYNIFKEEFENNSLDSSDISRFRRAANALGKEYILSDLDKHQQKQRGKKHRRIYQEENLVAVLNDSHETFELQGS